RPSLPRTSGAGPRSDGCRGGDPHSTHGSIGDRVMTSRKSLGQVHSTRPWLLLAACVALGLAACTGDSGKTGNQGPDGPPGPPGEPPSGTNPVGTAKVINASITNVTVPDDGQPVVEVRLTNEKGTPLS